MIIPAQVSLSNLFECDNKVIKSNCFQFRKSSKIVNYTKLKCQKQMLSYLKCLECRNFNAFLEPTVNELWLLFYFYSMFVVSTCVITTAICFHVLSLLWISIKLPLFWNSFFCIVLLSDKCIWHHPHHCVTFLCEHAFYENGWLIW